MSGRGDERAARALHRALERGPADVLDLLPAMRAALEGLLEGREGALHPILHRELRAERVLAGGRSERGLTLYRLPGAPEPPSAEDVPLPGGLDPKIARASLQVASAARDPAERGRVQADVLAHLQDLGATGGAFGSARAVRGLLQRVDRGRTTVCLVADAGDGLRRFAVHEGPWILGAVAMFFLLKLFVVEVYQIPSSSMEPTLQIGDRVVVFLPGGSEQPERWRIVTFVRDGVTYVKRVVGLPEETIELRHGDVYVNDELLVKPDDVREAMRKPLRSWRFTDGLPQEWRLDVDEDAERVWAFDRDGFAPHGQSERGNSYALRDGYLALEAERPAGGAVVLEMRRDGGEGGEAPATWFLSVQDDGISLSEARGDASSKGAARLATAEGVAPRGRLRLELSYVDGVLRAACGGWRFEDARAAPDGPLTVRIHAVGAACRALSLRLDGDLHYANLGTHGVPSSIGDESMPHRIAPGRLFVMGDNTTNSTDSRFSEVGDVPISTLVGPVRFRIWPPARLGTVR